MVDEKRILIVSQHYWPESFRSTDIADFFVENDCEVEVLCGIPNYPKGKFFDGYGYFHNRKQKHNSVSINRAFEIPRGSSTNVRIFMNYVSFPLASLFHIPRLLTKKYDKIFIFQTSPVMMSIAGILIGKIKKVETTMYVLDLWPENLFSVVPVKSRFWVGLANWVSNWHYKNTDKLVALSQRMKDRLVKTTGKSDEEIIVLPQACEKLYETDIYDKGLTTRYKTGFKILFTGSITPAQSFETILSAAKILKGDGIDDINWIIVGDGMSRKWLEEEITRTGLKDSFHFEGLKPVEDIPRYTAIADVLIGCLVKSPLLEATIPAKVMSYFAAGRPMVLAMDGEVQELMNNTIKCGYAGPTEDPVVLAENIKKIYGLSPTARTKMGQLGRIYHMKHFERNIILGKLYHFIFS